MKKTLILLMLFVMGVTLCLNAVALAEEPPEEETPELYNSTAQVMVCDFGAVNLDEEPEPEPEDDGGEIAE